MHESAVSSRTELALFGGARAVPRNAGQLDWPVVTEDDRMAVLRVLDGGRLMANTFGESEVPALEDEWARRVGVEECIGVANGTCAISLALQSLGVSTGDEVIVPALTFVGTALAVTHIGAVPRYVDVDPVTFDLDPARLSDVIGPRTAAIVVVHLHGLPAEVDEVLTTARRHGLPVVEDAAQAHGARYHGREVGSLTDIGCFSLNATKNLPTCGEAGLVTTDDPALAEKMTMLRQFGELPDRRTRTHVARLRGWNAKPSPVQAAFARSQLRRFTAYDAARQRNVRRFLARVRPLPGLVPPTLPADRTHAWHILRFRFVPHDAGLDVTPAAFRQTLHRVLRAEGVPLSRYQVRPLPEQEGLRQINGNVETVPNDVANCPQTAAVIADSLTLQRRHLHPASGGLLASYVDAFEKVWENLDTVAALARRLDASEPTRRTKT